MALNQWSKRSLVLVAAIFAVGCFLIGSSSSQDAKRAAEGEEVGRYQLVVGAVGGDTIFDTKTGRFWQMGDDRTQPWVQYPSPINTAISRLPGVPKK